MGTKSHSDLLDRVKMCSDSIHPAAVWYREDVPELLSRLAVLEEQYAALEQDHAELGLDLERLREGA